MSWEKTLGGLTFALLCAACNDSSEPSARSQAQGGAAAAAAGGTSSPTSGGAMAGGSATAGAIGVSGSGTGGAMAGAGGTGPRPLYDVKVATWRGNAKGAYSLIHDDLCGTPSSLETGKASALLDARGLHAAFGAIAGSCGEKWPAVKALQAGGHEIINHSWDHTDHVASRNLAVQVDQADAALKLNVGPAATTFYIFPFDSFDAEAIAHIKALGYLGARGGQQGKLNPPDFSDDFALNYDVFGAGYSTYCDEGVCATEQLACCAPDKPCAEGVTYTDQGSRACRVSVVNAYVDAAISGNGWAIRELHGVDDGWEGIASDVYEEHLVYVASKVQARELWVATPTAVIKYRRAREACAPRLAGTRVVFSADPQCAKYTTKLTLVVRPQVASLTATVGGSPLPVERVGEDFLVEVDPGAGDVMLAP